MRPVLDQTEVPQLQRPEEDAGTEVAAPWHATEAPDVLARLETSAQRGLDAPAVARRLSAVGPNEVETEPAEQWPAVLLRQFTSTLIIILVIAAVVSALVGEAIDAAAIATIVVLNGILGFVQEWRAERALLALQQLLAPRCVVVRSGSPIEIDATGVVPGDLVRLETGDRIPADVRIVEAVDLRADESTLTGESSSVTKLVAPVNAEAPLAVRSSMAWMGTNITNGHGHGVVVATGMRTEFGRIAQLTAAIERDVTPLQRRLGQLGRQLGIAAVLIAAGVAVFGWLLGKDANDMFLTGVALAVAVVPEGLPAVVTITLALGVRHMARQRALIRRLQATETLGSTTVICADKTGTMTTNQMTIRHVWLPDGELDVTGAGYAPTGHFVDNGAAIEGTDREDLLVAVESGVLASRAEIIEDDHGWSAVGEPTEAAIVVAAHKAGIWRDAPRETVTEFSFTSDRKRMTVVTRHHGDLVAHTKGAPEVVLERATMIHREGSARPLIEHDRAAFVAAYQHMAHQGLRTLAIARRVLPEAIDLEADTVETELVILAVVGMEDAPRPEVATAIDAAARAGVRTLMITGDALETALSIAGQVGLATQLGVTGPELDTADDGTLDDMLAAGAVFARTTPRHKMRIVQALQRTGEVVAMTGDGVNDAPALRRADVGVAMGQRGTDVARAAADMVLSDDNYASIVGAVREGRRQYDNIQKFIRYLLTSNLGELLAVFINLVTNAPLILLPVHILWVNLVTDGLSAVALGLEPGRPELMQRKPRPAAEPVLNRDALEMVMVVGAFEGAATLWTFQHVLNGGASLVEAQTMAFTVLVVLELLNVFNFRSLRAPLTDVGFCGNRPLLIALAINVGLQLCAVYLPALQTPLHTTALGWSDWGLILLVSAPILAIGEGLKAIQRRRRPL